MSRKTRIPAWDREHGLSVWVVALFFSGVFFGLCAWSWRKWPDTLVDYGSALYVPTQLVFGKVLYRDMTNLVGGPLSHYFHRLLFQMFGASFTVLICTSLILIALLTCLLYRLFLRASDQWTAIMACLTVLCVFAFSQYVVTGNYNYVCPYCYEAFHGLLLSVAAIACLCRWIVTGSKAWAFTAGLGVGGVFLTKPDLFVSVSAALLMAGLMERTGRWTRPRPRLQGYGLIALGAVLPGAAFLVYFKSVWSFVGGLKAISGSWTALLTTSVATNPFYQGFLGLDRPAASLWLILRRFAAFLLALGFAGLFARAVERRHAAASVTLGLALVAIELGAWTTVKWVESGSALAPIALVTAGVLTWNWWKNRGSAAIEPLVFPVLWAIFAVSLLAKMGLKPRIWHYGFYLGMPAALLAVFVSLSLLPKELARFQVNPDVFRAVITLFLLTGIVQLLRASDYFYRAKDSPVGQGADRIIGYSGGTYEPGPALQRAIGLIRDHTLPSSTLAVLPEGCMINYLTGRPNPTPYQDLNPTEMLAYGESNVLAAYEQHSPDYILLVHRDTSEWRANYFGAAPGYGYEMLQWIRANYSPVWLLGHEPLQTNLFGIKLLRRNDVAESRRQ